MSRKEYIAHVKLHDNGEWASPHYLEEHLRDVELLASDFAKNIGSDWAGLSGRWHDLGGGYRL